MTIGVSQHKLQSCEVEYNDSKAKVGEIMEFDVVTSRGWGIHFEVSNLYSYKLGTIKLIQVFETCWNYYLQFLSTWSDRVRIYVFGPCMNYDKHWQEVCWNETYHVEVEY